MKDPKKLKTAYDAAKKLTALVESIDQRCMAADGPVTPTVQEMTAAESASITGWIKTISRQVQEVKCGTCAGSGNCLGPKASEEGSYMKCDPCNGTGKVYR